MRRLCLLFVLMCSPLSALELQKYPTVLSTAKSQQVVIVPTQTGNQALVRVTGVNNPIDEVVFLTNIESNGNLQRYTYQYDGEKRSLVTQSGRGYFTLYLPDQGKGIYLSEDNESRSADVTDNTYAQYQQQLEQGIQKQLALFDRDYNVKEQQENVESASIKIGAQCGQDMTTNVNWSQISDEVIQKYSVGSFCSMVAESITSRCKSHPEFKAKVKGFNKIDCVFGNELKLRHTDTAIQFKTTGDEPNQQEFIRSYLRNL